MCLLVQADPRSDLSEFRCEMRPVYEDPTDNAGCNLNLEWIAGAVSQLMGFILIDKETGKCEANLGASQLAILLYGVRLLNISCRLNLGLSQVYSLSELRRICQVTPSVLSPMLSDTVRRTTRTTVIPSSC